MRRLPPEPACKVDETIRDVALTFGIQDPQRRAAEGADFEHLSSLRLKGQLLGPFDPCAGSGAGGRGERLRADAAAGNLR